MQVVNYSHLFPTRYALELESLKGAVTSDTFKEPSQREDAKKTIKKLFEEKYTGGKNKWFFTPLRVCFMLRCYFVGDSDPAILTQF
jgi:large subunit ribosomal protein L27e